MLENRSHTESCFVTLTYDEEHVPRDKQGRLVLKKTDVQKYLKRLRRKLRDQKIRYLAIGEYGDRYGRPHYHLIIYGIGSLLENDITTCWSDKKGAIGNVVVGGVTNHSARYCAGYCVKKLNRATDPRLEGKPPEFLLSSRRGGGLGKKEVIRIAQKIKENPYWDENTIINSFTIGGKPYPLGGYLSSILFQELGQSEELRQSMLWAWQQKLFNENDAHTVDYYTNIIEKSEQKRANLAVKQKLYQQRKIL